MQVLGLGIVIPQMMAGQERYWIAHSGKLPGSTTPLPFAAPVDNFLEIGQLVNGSKPTEKFGPHIPYREYSFLSNPETPSDIRDSQIVVNICSEKEAHCSDGSEPAIEHEGALWIMPGMDDVQLKVALGEAAEGKICKSE